MLRVKSKDEFIKFLAEEYPEKLLKVLDIEYTEEEILDYIKDREIDDFYPELFKDGIRMKRELINGIGGTQLTMIKNPSPITGDLYLDQNTNTIMVYDGGSWITTV